MANWSPTQPLPSDWAEPSIGFDGQGEVRAAYLQVLSLNPISTRLAIAERRNGAWVDVFEKRSLGDVIPVDVTLAVGADGTAAACFTALTSIDPATYQVRHFVTYAPATTRAWEVPTEIVSPSTPGPFISQRGMRVSDNGIAVVIADRFDGPRTAPTGSVILTVHPPSTAWTAPQTLGPAGGLNGSARLGVDGFGNATVAWIHRYQNTPERSSVRVATVSPAGVVTPSAALTPENGTNAGNVVLDVNYVGNAVLGTQFGLHANVTTRASQTGPWEPFTPLFNSTTASSSFCGAVAVTLSGMSYVLAWRQGPSTSGNDVICAARRGTYGIWTNPKPISVTNAMLNDAGIGIRKGLSIGNEDVALVYTASVGYGGGDPGLGLYQACHWPTYLSNPRPPVNLAEQGPHHDLDQVVADNVDGVLSIETRRDLTTAHSYVTAFDASAPEIVEAVVPATATVGQVVQLRSRLADAWSPMGPINWDFGDGTPAGNSATVTHSWAAPGPYDVVLSAADIQGNTATRTFTVTVNP